MPDWPLFGADDQRASTAGAVVASSGLTTVSADANGAKVWTQLVASTPHPARGIVVMVAPSNAGRCLLDIGVEPFLITATLEAVVGQRLVRTICSNCKQSYQPGEEVLRELGQDGASLAEATFFFGSGCELCHHTGYRGRTGIYEVMQMNDELRQAVTSGASTAALRAKAVAAGMKTLRENGLAAVTEGRTTVEEILQETLPL